MKTFTRITFDAHVLSGRPCIQEMRVAGMLVGPLAAGRTRPDILTAYPYVEDADISETLSYAAWRVEGIDVPLAVL